MVCTEHRRDLENPCIVLTLLIVGMLLINTLLIERPCFNYMSNLLYINDFIYTLFYDILGCGTRYIHLDKKVITNI